MMVWTVHVTSFEVYAGNGGLRTDGGRLTAEVRQSGIDMVPPNIDNLSHFHMSRLSSPSRYFHLYVSASVIISRDD